MSADRVIKANAQIVDTGDQGGRRAARKHRFGAPQELEFETGWVRAVLDRAWQMYETAVKLPQGLNHRTVSS